MGNPALVATNSEQISHAMMNFIHPLTDIFSKLPQWMPMPIKVLFFTAIFLLGIRVASTVFLILREVFITAVINLARKLEPQPIAETRSKLTTELEDIQKHLEKTKNDSFRIQCENTWLRDKVDDLEKARKALIEELGGASSDNTHVEFELWQQMTTVVNILVADRIWLLSLLDVAVSSGGAKADETTVNQENLLKQVYKLNESYKRAQQEIASLKTATASLKTQNKQLEIGRLSDQRETERLASEVARVDRLKQELKTVKTNAESKNTEIKALRKKISKLEKTRDELTHELQDSGQHDHLEQQIQDLTQRLRKLEFRNQDLVRENENLSVTIEALTEQPENFENGQIDDSYCSPTTTVLAPLYVSSGHRNSRSNIVASAEFCLNEYYTDWYDELDRHSYIMNHQEDLNDEWDI
jgi:regulator of replication initiation timing